MPFFKCNLNCSGHNSTWRTHGRSCNSSNDHSRPQPETRIWILLFSPPRICLPLLNELPWQATANEVLSLAPQLATASAKLEQARWALRLACAQVTPNVTGTVGVGYDAATDDTFARIGISVPLPIRNRNQGNIRAARASMTTASEGITAKQLQLQKSLADSIGNYQVARQTYQRIRDEISPAASESYELARTAFVSGETDFLKVLNAQKTWFDTQLSALNAFETAQKENAEIQGSSSQRFNRRTFELGC